MALNTAARYYIPAPSQWPIIGSSSLFLMAIGTALWINDASFGRWLLLLGFMGLVYMMFGWFGTVARESETGAFNRQVDVSFRWGMSWFIFSEVMFFAAFFGALFWARVMSVPDLGSVDAKLLWPDFVPTWPSVGPGGNAGFTEMDPWGLPALNTLFLLVSGVTLTFAHHALKANHRRPLILWMFATVALGIAFLGCQAYEYVHAYHELNLKLTSGIYGSTFFMLTGFHGFHVTVGTIMLITILVRCMKGHFLPEHHFGFEAVAWYWHFVDVVWLLLFVLVYWL